MSEYQCLKSVPPFLSSLLHSSLLSFLTRFFSLFWLLSQPVHLPTKSFLHCLNFCAICLAPTGYLWTSALWHPWCSWCGNHVWPQKKLFSHWGQRPSGSLHCVTWAGYRSHTYRPTHTHTQMPPNSSPCLCLTSHAHSVSATEWTA